MFVTKEFDPQSMFLCSVEGEGDDGEGGGEGEGEKKPILDEDAKKWMVNQINAAMTHHLKRGSFNEVIEGATKKAITEALEAAQIHRQESEEGGTVKVEEDPKYKALQARLEAQEQRYRKIEEERTAEATRAKKREEERALESALRQAGVPDNRLRAALALIRTDGVVGRNDSDGIVWRANRDGYVDELTVMDGVREFLGTEEGKTFIPPTPAKGSGDKGTQKRTPGGPPTSGDEMSKEEALTMLGNFLMYGGKGQ